MQEVPGRGSRKLAFTEKGARKFSSFEFYFDANERGL